MQPPSCQQRLERKLSKVLGISQPRRPPNCHHPSLERGVLWRGAESSAGVRWNSALFPSERESIALLLRLNLKEVKLKPHKKYDYYKMLKPLPAGPEPCLSHPCLGCRSHNLTL